MLGLFTQKQIDKSYVPRDRHEKLHQEVKDIQTELDMQREIFKLIYDVVLRWKENKMGNLRAITTIYRMMFGTKKEKGTHYEKKNR